MPGSGFAQTFIGMDVVVVMFLISKARRLARKWGGQCIIFIDEIDAVGHAPPGASAARAAAASPSRSRAPAPSTTTASTGRWARSPDRRPDPRDPRPGASGCSRPARPRSARSTRPGSCASARRSRATCSRGMGGMGGGMALNQLLVQMDGVDDPPFMRKLLHEPHQHVPRRDLHRPAAHRQALAAPARRRSPAPSRSTSSARPTSRSTSSTRRSSGRGAWAATSGSARPRKDDRKDIFELYMAKVDHDPELDTDRRRDELSRITNGYSPAMIEQVCSMALTYAHSEGRTAVRVAGHRGGDDHDRVGHRVRASTTCPPRRARWPSTRPATPPPATST